MKIQSLLNIKIIMSLLLRNIFETLAAPLENAILQLNRNGRFPKPANHGARPCSSVMRRLKKKEYYRRWKPSTPLDIEDWGASSTAPKAD
jgi:hypothetical protein